MIGFRNYLIAFWAIFVAADASLQARFLKRNGGVLQAFNKRNYSGEAANFLTILARANTLYTMNELMGIKSKSKLVFTDCLAAKDIANGALECSTFISEYLATLPYLIKDLKPVKRLPSVYLKAFKAIEIPKPVYDFDIQKGEVIFGINYVRGYTPTKVQISRVEGSEEELQEVHRIFKQMQMLCGSGSDYPLKHLSNALYAVSDSVMRGDGRVGEALRNAGYKDTNLLFSPQLRGRMTWKQYCKAANLSPLECSNLARILFAQIKSKPSKRDK